MSNLSTTLSNIISVSHNLPAPSIESNSWTTRLLRLQPSLVSATNNLRRSSYASTIADNLVYAAGPIVVLSKGRSGLRYFTNSHFGPSVRRIKYGKGERNVVYYSPCPTSPPTRPAVLFVHGGAWGTGNATIYMTVISALNERGYDAAVVNYNLGPENSAGGQAEEVREAGRRVVEVSGGKDLVVVGHSSGAHVGLLSVLMGGNEGDPWVSGFVGLGGVYDVCMHYDYEARRGLEQLSPMQPACGYTRERMRENGARESKMAADFFRTVDLGGGRVEEIYGLWDHQRPAIDWCFGGECLDRVLDVLHGGRKGATGRSKL